MRRDPSMRGTSRRRWALSCLAVAGMCVGVDQTTVSTAASATPSVQGAYSFLDHMMDLYATGSSPRLVQSFTGGALAQQAFTDSETYDDALMIDAFLAEGTSDGTMRAEVLGSSLLLVQSRDGRIRAAYAPTPLLNGRGRVAARITDRTSDVGNMAWVGMALTKLYAATGVGRYLDGAEAIGTWVRRNCYDRRGAGGYTGGRSARGSRIRWKSTEHNVDLYGLYTMLATETGDPAWSADATWARTFVQSMWNATNGSFYVGTTADGITPNTAEQPEDVNSWSFLALQDPAYASSIDWAVDNLAVSAGPLSGVSFCLGDKSGVWFEGTAHLADALELRNASGDAAQAARYLADIQLAQTSGPNTDGLGIVAASKDGLSDCDGSFYYASLHTGATSWYILASAQLNPFVL